jgi:hypothetical protein
MKIEVFKNGWAIVKNNSELFEFAEDRNGCVSATIVDLFVNGNSNHGKYPLRLSV